MITWGILYFKRKAAEERARLRVIEAQGPAIDHSRIANRWRRRCLIAAALCSLSFIYTTTALYFVRSYIDRLKNEHRSEVKEVTAQRDAAMRLAGQDPENRFSSILLETKP